MTKHLLGIDGLGRAEIEQLLELSEYFLEVTRRDIPKVPALRGKVVVLAFGASWLPLSRPQLQGVKKLADKYGERGVVVYWVSTEPDNTKAKNYASDEQLRAFGKKYGTDVAVLRDPDMTVAKKLGAVELPSVVILNKQGSLSGEPIKGLDPDGNQMGQLASQLEKLL